MRKIVTQEEKNIWKERYLKGETKDKLNKAFFYKRKYERLYNNLYDNNEIT